MKRLIAAVLIFCTAAFALPFGALALEPALETSAAYQNSVYYERLCDVELSGEYRTDLVRVALSQVGYHEGEGLGDYGGDNYAGWHNYMEYSSAYFGYNEQWCAMFVSWCARQAGIPKYVINNAASAYSDGTDGSKKGCFHLRVCYPKKYTPVTGDIVFFSSTGWGANHVGIVAAVTDTGIYTVEGNKLNAVRVNYYDFDSEYIAYYGVYSYTETKLPVPELSELRFVYSEGEHGSMPDGDPYAFDSLLALHGAEVTLPDGAFSRDGHKLLGYFVRCDDDGTWYCGDDGWLPETLACPELIDDGATWCFDGAWRTSGSFTFFCVWEDEKGNVVYDSALAGEVTDGERSEEILQALREHCGDTLLRLCGLKRLELQNVRSSLLWIGQTQKSTC